MKSTFFPLILLLLSSILLTCQRMVTEPDLLQDGNPRIKSLAFEGIPAQNVVIDQKKLLINITAPETIPNVIQIQPTLVLTDSAKLINSVNWHSIFYQTPGECPKCFTISLTRQGATSPITSYTVNLLAGGPLMLEASNPSVIETVLGSPVFYPC